MTEYKQIESLVSEAKHIVILQADNPDGDSLGSSLALEAILSELGKRVSLVCAVDMPQHLRYLDGWSRVQKEIPHDFDLSIMVDVDTESLFENYMKDAEFAWVKTKPLIVIDHHLDSRGISFATLTIKETAVATSEIIYRIATALGWTIPLDAAEMMAVSIMSDSIGLVSEATTPESIRIIADLVELGVSLAKLDQARRELMRKETVLIPYKGELLQRISYDSSGRIASVVIPWDEIERYSPLYNPTMLVIDDMRLIVGVDIAIGYKVYPDGKVTAKIRCNYGRAIAHELAEAFGGGGHPYAAGFKILKKIPIEELKVQVHQKANELLDTLERAT